MQAAEFVTMSARELDRLTVIERILEKRLTQVEAAKQLGITPRQVRRLIRRYSRDGAMGLVSKKRGKRSNSAYPESLKSVVLILVRKDYHDFGPTLVYEKLLERHVISLSVTALRSRMIDDATG